MIDDSERRTLDDIEDRLSAADPTWVERFGSTQRHLPVVGRPAWKQSLLIVGAFLTATLALLALVVSVPSLTALSIAGTVWLLWLVQQPLHPGEPASAPRLRRKCIGGLYVYGGRWELYCVKEGPRQGSAQVDVLRRRVPNKSGHGAESIPSVRPHRPSR